MGALVLPDSTDGPTGQSELDVVETVALHVAIELCRPPGPVRHWSCRVLRTPVPEAAINKHCQAKSWEDNVSLTTEPYHWPVVLSEAIAGPVQS
jgi:hypothetical protein